ncbi:SigB/SigF/SigG family RNA polymerase sigma factor [Streptomyces sp. TRM70308]|uniref:SigB/SigF/SigG family RNA polymerase sigma factor n=1 Tax=Streptomyces sp. TRM70308 TaxID=3131932 RepID=UPI003D0785D5
MSVRAHHTHRPDREVPQTDAAFEQLVSGPSEAERESLRREIVTAWMPMARRLARRYRNRGENLEDLEQVAAMGLVKAVDRFDPHQGHRFESFAVPTIVGELRRHFRDHLWDLHVPRRVQELQHRVRKAVQELNHGAEDRGPTVARVAEHTGMSEEDVIEGFEALGSFSTLSLDAQTAGASAEGLALTDVLGNVDARYDQVIYREAVKPQLQRLPERERHILYLRFFCDMTQSRIAEQLGISQMHVSRLLNRTFTRIRENVDQETEHRPRHLAAA